MYTHIFHCSKEDFTLAKEEILSLIPHKFFMQFNNFILLGIDEKKLDKSRFEKLAQRLAYTNSVFEILFSSPKVALEEYIRKFDWNKIYETSFSVRKIALTREEIDDKKYTENYLGKLVGEQLEKPRVDLKTSKTRFAFFYFDRIYATKHIVDTDKTYLERKPHMKPEMHPTSLNPKIARVCINLTGIQDGNLLDPFCGSAGIIVEAGLMGLNVIGSDLDEVMLNRSKINLDEYKIKNYKLIKGDATNIEEEFDTIVTDLPYGRNSSLHGKDMLELYTAFLESAHYMAKKKSRIVVMMPDNVDPSIIKKFKIKSTFTFYLHKSLSKKVYVLQV